MFHRPLFVTVVIPQEVENVYKVMHPQTHTNMSVVEHIGQIPRTRTFPSQLNQPSAIQYMSKKQ